jgi:hypothetical protein
MISKIIQKEKERQEKLTTNNCKCEGCEHVTSFQIKEHKQSLINLKEYMEEVLLPWSCHCTDQIKEDIKELNKMIERYG